MPKNMVSTPVPGSLNLLTAIKPCAQDVNERGELTLARMQGGLVGLSGWVPLFSDCFQETNGVIALNHWQGSNFRFLGTLRRHSSHSLLTSRLRSRPRRTSQSLPKEYTCMLSKNCRHMSKYSHLGAQLQTQQIGQSS